MRGSGSMNVWVSKDKIENFYYKTLIKKNHRDFNILFFLYLLLPHPSMFWLYYLSPTSFVLSPTFFYMLSPSCFHILSSSLLLYVIFFFFLLSSNLLLTSILNLSNSSITKVFLFSFCYDLPSFSHIFSLSFFYTLNQVFLFFYYLQSIIIY